MLVRKIKEYLETHTIQDLHNETGIATGVFYSMLKRDWKKYGQATLDILYTFFKIPRDQYYNDNLKKRYPKTPSMFGTFVRGKRLKLEVNLDVLSKTMGMDKRALARLEAGDALPTFDSFTMSSLFTALDFSEDDKLWTKNYVETMKYFEKQIKKYGI